MHTEGESVATSRQGKPKFSEGTNECGGLEDFRNSLRIISDLNTETITVFTFQLQESSTIRNTTQTLSLSSANTYYSKLFQLLDHSL